MENKINKYIYWIPRIFGIIFVLFLALFSLDIFDSATGFKEIAIGLFMHNIPALILSAVVIISWKHELVGAISFAVAGLLYCGLIIYNILFSGDPTGWYMLAWIVQIAGPAFIVAWLFYKNWKFKQIIKK
ncbi:MAG: hypothetical protein V1898_03845 [Patescibacteria group bacterium]